ncbi:MAG TPA: transglycosylase SLT domain-containing protein, partial [Burkholderiales bacterium]|nr:transglycosylase SLT domain-containing protein [Burkholderiales bacterium]
DRVLVSAYENPYRYLKRERPIHSRAQKEIAIFALMRIARADPLEARTFWSRMESRFGEEDRNYVQGKIAFQAALKHMPEALQWFKAAGKLDDAELGWKARAGLRAGDWPSVLSSIAAMSSEEQNSETWRYWKARSLKAQGKLPEANAILAGLSHEHDYYGQLALEELGTVVAPPPDAYKASDSEITDVMHVPGIERALLLYSMGLRLDATREWIWAIKGFSDRQLLAAAELAKRRGLYDRAINTAEKTVKLYDFDLRFLAPYRDIMHVQTEQLGLDEAWVYGLIRQESRFVTAAKSGTGASGLMQLMPATARWVASKMGLRNFHHSLVNQIETNISLGTYYLKHVLTVFDNQPVLASAAYNAGPGKARQWVGPSPMEGAIYIETIPYGETRDYVKKVMSNTEYYASAFGQESVSLKDRLGVVGKADYGTGP